MPPTDNVQDRNLEERYREAGIVGCHKIAENQRWTHFLFDSENSTEELAVFSDIDAAKGFLRNCTVSLLFSIASEKNLEPTIFVRQIIFRNPS